VLLNYHVGRLFLSLLCVGDFVRLVLGGVRFAGFSLGQVRLLTRMNGRKKKRRIFSLLFRKPTSRLNL
jgi:hypothetical protein